MNAIDATRNVSVCNYTTYNVDPEARLATPYSSRAYNASDSPIPFKSLHFTANLSQDSPH